MTAPTPTPTPATSRWLDLGLLLKEKVEPIDWLIDGVLPSGTVGDVFGGPGTGKSSVILSLALTVAAGGGTWFGKKVAGGRVMILGGEKSARKIWVTDLNRCAAGMNIEIEAQRIIAPDGSVGSIWQWMRDGWQTGPGFDYAVEEAKKFGPTLTIIDTIGRGALGQDPIDIPQQQMLANLLEKFRERVGGTVLTISHTNQASGKDTLRNRLRYESRAGGNGLPGHLRWLLAMTPVRPEESAIWRGVEVEDDAAMEAHEMRSLVAVSVAKHNEMPRPKNGWSNHQPLILEMMEDGSLMSLGYTSAATLEIDAQTVAERKAAKRSEGRQKKKSRWSKPRKPTSSAEDTHEAGRRAVLEAPDVFGDEYDESATRSNPQAQEDDDGRF